MKTANVKILNDVKALIKQTDVYMKHGPSHEKYALAQTIRNELYTFLGLITEAYMKYTKKTTLQNADVCLEKIRIFYSIWGDYGYFSFKRGKHDEKTNGNNRRFVIDKMITEIGKQLGGWIKAENEKASKTEK